MRFFFDAPGIEGGFVWLRDDPYKNCVEATTGYGTERKIGIYSLPRRRESTPLDPERQEALCRAAICFVLKMGGAHAGNGPVDEQDEQWQGELHPVPPKA